MVTTDLCSLARTNPKVWKSCRKEILKIQIGMLGGEMESFLRGLVYVAGYWGVLQPTSRTWYLLRCAARAGT